MADIVVAGDNGTDAIVGTATPANIIVNGSLVDPQGPAGASGAHVDYMLALAAQNPESMIFGPITRDVNYIVTSAGVIWPDGIAGTFTTDVISNDFNTIDSYHITYGSTTYTQPTVTRDVNGAVTIRPGITVT